MADIESDYLTLQNAIDAKNRETGTGHLLNEVSAKRRRLKLLEPLAAVFNAPKANFQAESGVGLVEYGLPGYDDVLKTVTALRAEVNRLSLAIDKSNATTEVTVDLKTVTPYPKTLADGIQDKKERNRQSHRLIRTKTPVTDDC